MVAFEREDVMGVRLDDLFGDVFWQPIASQVMMQPLSSRMRRSSGMAVI